jgi:hypothetical protein
MLVTLVAQPARRKVTVLVQPRGWASCTSIDLDR